MEVIVVDDFSCICNSVSHALPSESHTFEGANFGSLPTNNHHIDDNNIPLIIELMNNLPHKESEYLYMNRALNSDIIVSSVVEYTSSNDFVIQTKGSIIFKEEGKIINHGKGGVILKSGVPAKEDLKPSNINNATISFEGNSPQITLTEHLHGSVKLYYNPLQVKGQHKYQNPIDYTEFIKPESAVKSYMWVNNVKDLQMINLFLSGDYALSSSIDASSTSKWQDGAGFLPLGKKDYPFSGDFDGCGHTIFNLFINRPDMPYVGMFGFSNHLPCIR